MIFNRYMITTMALMAATEAASAQSRNVALEAPASLTTTSATVRHIGNPPGSAVFQVLYDNPTGERFTVIIKDMEGAVLYQDRYSDRKFDKKYQLPQEQSGQLKFIIKGSRSNQVQTFEVHANIRVIEAFVVKRVG